MKIKAVFFDLDDTLHDAQYPFEQSVKKLFPEIIPMINMNYLYKKFREVSDLLWEDYVANDITLSDLRIQRILLAIQSSGFSIDSSKAQLFQKQYESNQSQLKMFPEVISILGALKEKGILIGMITNGPVDHQLNKISSLGLNNHFPGDLIFVSDGVGVAKPNPDIFHHVRKKIDIEPDKLLYVGDTWENDIVGSSEAGWKSLWFNHREREAETNHQPLAIIHNINDVLKYI